MEQHNDRVRCAAELREIAPDGDIPLVSVVVVSWNRRDDISRCLRSLTLQSYPRVEIILVDNKSDDGTVEMVRNQFPEVRIVEIGENIGCGPARNIGYDTAAGEYLMQIDDDATIEAHGVGKLVDVFQAEPQVGAVAFRIVSFPSQRDCTADFDRYTKNFWGAGAAIRTSVWRQVGPYPRREYFSTEEFDFCLRVHDAGYRVRYLPEVTVNHYPAGERRRIEPWRLRYALASWLWIFPKYFPWRLVPFFWARVLVSYLILAVRHQRVGTYLYTIGFAVLGLPAALQQRRCLRPCTVEYFWNPSVLPDRFNVGIFRKLLQRLRAGVSPPQA